MKQLPIYRILRADKNIDSLLADRIFEDIASEGTTTPYAVWSDLSGTPNTSIDNLINEDKVFFQIMVYSKTSDEATKIRTAIANVLSEHTFIDARFGHFESDTRLFVRGFSGNWWLDR